jgi:hypothetical protein
MWYALSICSLLSFLGFNAKLAKPNAPDFLHFLKVEESSALGAVDLDVSHVRPRLLE